MAVTTLDPITALVVVDLQKGIIGAPIIDPIRQVVERSRTLIDGFRVRRLPVVLVNVAGRSPGRTEQPRRQDGPLAHDFTDFTPGLGRHPDDIVVTKRSWGAFATTDLDAILKGGGITQVVITGVATGTGVEATARQAYEGGYNVTLAIDAMTDTRPEAHAFSLRHVFPRLGETGTSQEIIDLLPASSA